MLVKGSRGCSEWGQGVLVRGSRVVVKRSRGSSEGGQWVFVKGSMGVSEGVNGW